MCVKYAMHHTGKKRLGTKERAECDITEASKASDEVAHPVG